MMASPAKASNETCIVGGMCWIREWGYMGVLWICVCVEMVGRKMKGGRRVKGKDVPLRIRVEAGRGKVGEGREEKERRREKKEKRTDNEKEMEGMED